MGKKEMTATAKDLAKGILDSKLDDIVIESPEELIGLMITSVTDYRSIPQLVSQIFNIGEFRNIYFCPCASLNEHKSSTIQFQILKHLKKVGLGVIFKSPNDQNILLSEQRLLNGHFFERLISECQMSETEFHYIIDIKAPKNPYEDVSETRKSLINFIKNILGIWDVVAPEVLGRLYLQNSVGYNGRHEESTLEGLLYPVVSEIEDIRVSLCVNTAALYAAGELPPRPEVWNHVDLVNLGSVAQSSKKGDHKDRHRSASFDSCLLGSKYVRFFLETSLDVSAGILLDRNNVSASLVDLEYLKAMHKAIEEGVFDE